LSEIFTDLAPPHPKKESLDIVDDTAHLLHHPLYSFQRETVAQMLEREISNVPQVDPTFTCLSSVDRGSEHQFVWVQPSTMNICLEPPKYMSKEGGGILSEEMGAGKTVILLALIMATRDRLALPDGREDGNIMVTSLTARYSQTQHHRELRKQYSISEPDKIPTLVENLLHFLACHPDSVTNAPYRIRELFESSSLAQLSSRLPPFYFDHGSNSRAERKGEKNVKPPAKLYLTRASLVVVPASLYEQWKGEIYKFCRDGALKVLFAKDIDFRLPRAVELASYDVSS
jgi:SNF2 family DNA or RNA helicase